MMNENNYNNNTNGYEKANMKKIRLDTVVRTIPDILRRIIGPDKRRP